jgi:hypothetical protein
MKANHDQTKQSLEKAGFHHGKWNRLNVCLYEDLFVGIRLRKSMHYHQYMLQTTGFRRQACGLFHLYF